MGTRASHTHNGTIPMPAVALPATKSTRDRSAEWDGTPAADRDGTLTVHVPRKPADKYAVTFFPHDLPGRGFRLVKVAGGSDPEETAYDVFLADRPHSDSCDCKGFVRFGKCKHASAIRLLLPRIETPLAGDPRDFADTERQPEFAPPHPFGGPFAEATPEGVEAAAAFLRNLG